MVIFDQKYNFGTLNDKNGNCCAKNGAKSVHSSLFKNEQKPCVRNKELGFDSFHHIYQMIWYNRGFREISGG